MKTRRLILIGGLVSAALLAIFGDRSGPVEAVAFNHVHSPPPVTPRTDTANVGTPGVPEGADNAAILMLEDRTGRLASDGSKAQADAVLFAVRSWAPPPPPPAAPQKATAPPLPFTYLGKQFEGGQWQVFLAREKAVLIVNVNDLVDDTYRIESIAPPTMTVLYLPLKETQQMAVQ